LRFSARFALDSGAGDVLAANVFSANGIFACNITAAGGQPTGFDQHMALYDHFTVIGSKISVHCASSTAAADLDAEDQVYCFVTSLTTNVALTTLDEYVRQQDKTPRLQYIGHADGSAASRWLTDTVSTKKWFKVANIIGESQFQGTIAANPTEGVFFHVCAAPVTVAQNPPAINCYAIIDYIVAFTDPVNVALSN